MTAILIAAAIVGVLMAVGGFLRALEVMEENFETGGGSPYGCFVCILGIVIFLGSVGALIGRAYL